MYEKPIWATESRKETLALLVKRILVVDRGQYRIEWQPGVKVFLPK